MADQEEPEHVLGDNDSALGDGSDTSSLGSLKSSILNFQLENGRRYHALSKGKYMLPNDERENNRLDLQHHLFMLTLDGKYALSPGAENAQQVLDIGTGTGIWAIEYADDHPQAKVIGVDLSPIQPLLVPPTCMFEIDDVEEDWTWNQHFDFIFSRMMAGCFKDVSKVLEQAFLNLQPGGYFEFQDCAFPIQCDDNSLPETSAILKWSNHLTEAANNLGRPIGPAQDYKSQLRVAGFVDVTEVQFKWPQNGWPKDRKRKELGMWALANFDDGLEGLSLALLTRGLKWKKEEVHTFLVDVRKELRNKDIHAYWPIYVVYGRKPKTTEGETASPA